jgi:hypothetical protein
MCAQLITKSEDASHLASRPSELTAESLTAVLTKALQVERNRQERRRAHNTDGPGHGDRKGNPRPCARTGQIRHNWMHDIEPALKD